MTEKEQKQVNEFKAEVEGDIHAKHKSIETVAAFIVLILFAALAVFGATWYVDNAKSSDDYVSQVTVNKNVTSKTTQSDWKTYTNNVFNFSLKYPSTWTLTDNIQKDAVTMGGANNSLGLANAEKYDLKLWANPGGFGAEGLLVSVNYENNESANGKVLLGQRKYTKMTQADQDIMGTEATGFGIHATVKYLGKDYIFAMLGKDVSDVEAAEKDFKEILSTFQWSK